MPTYFRKIKALIEKTKKREAQKQEQEIKKREAKEHNIKIVPRAEKLTLYSDCIYRSHIDPKKIFGEDVSFCYGGYSEDLEHYKTVPFSEFAEGSFMFELTFLDDADEILDYVNPITHHPGAGRGTLPKDGLNISRIFFDPTDFKEENDALKYIQFLQQEQIQTFGPGSDITKVHINREELTEKMNSHSHPSIKLKFKHPNHIHKEKEDKSVTHSHSIFSSKTSVAPSDTSDAESKVESKVENKR